MTLEREAFQIGCWKSIEELEENVTLPELEEIIKGQVDLRMRDYKFQAGLQGAEIDIKEDDDRKGVEERAEQKIREWKAEQYRKAGMNPEAADLASFGISVVQE